MKVFILAGDAFEARDLGRMLGLNVRDTVILNSEAVTRMQHPADGDLVLETKSACTHIEYAAIVDALKPKIDGKDVRWESES